MRFLFVRRDFARRVYFLPPTSGFLQIPPRDGHPCLRLTLPTAKRVADFHRQVVAHAGRTTYRCTVACAADVAKWVYVSNIKGATGGTGPAGADAITMSITSSNGTIFKNTGVSTTLTAHVYRAGAELSTSQIAELGTIKWYKDGSTTPLATTGATLNINASDVINKASYIAQLEG